jgi:FkbM family methyltransferase
VFLAPEAEHINRARLDHLGGLGLDLQGKRVLEVGAGIGLLTGFFEQRGCDVLSTDGNPANVAEMLRRYPERRAGLLDLDQSCDLSALGEFDIVFCYGTLYHLRDPDGALARLAAICPGVILLETVVSRGAHAELHLAGEPPVANQALGGIGCRPTRPWVMAALARHFGYAYTTRDQPEHPDFVTDWSVIEHTGNLRAVFVGSKQQLAVVSLTDILPVQHRNAPPRIKRVSPARVRIDVGAGSGENSRAAAAADAKLVVHTFDAVPVLHKIRSNGPPNYHAHAMAIAEQEGMAPFRIDSAAVSSSPSPDAAMRRGCSDVQLLPEKLIIYLPTIRLDGFMERAGIRRLTLLRFDSHGTGLAIVRSAGDRLADIDCIECEIPVAAAPVFAGATEKAILVAYLVGHGFRLVGTKARSDGQAETLTFLGMNVRRDDGPGVLPPQGVETMQGIYELESVISSHGEVRSEEHGLALTTAPEQWAYAAVIPLGAVAAELAERRVQVMVELEVEHGTVQVGILNREETDFCAAVMLAGETGWQEVTLVSPRLRRAGPLVIRNASDFGPSRARCRNLVVEVLPPGTPASEERAPGQAEAALHATAFDAAAAALAAAAAAQPAVAAAVAPAVRGAAERVRGLLAAGGRALVDPEAPEAAATFAGLGVEVLRRLAADLAFLQPIRPVPGWRFGAFLESADPATFVRYALWRAIQRRLPVPAVVVPWLGGTRLCLNFDNDLNQAIFVAGNYEPNEFALLDRVLRPGMTVLDGGANEGAFTVFLAARVGRNGLVLAVEPSSRELVRLRGNVAVNNADRVAVVPVALGEQEGMVVLTLAEDRHAGQNTLGRFIYPAVREIGRATVPATTLDALTQGHGLECLDVVKLDLEGAELRTLLGARRVLERFKPLLLLEAAEPALQRQGGSVRALVCWLNEAGYLLFRFDPPTGLPAPLLDDAEISENLVAVHRDRRFGL